MAGISVQEAHAWRYKFRESRMDLRKKTWQQYDEKEEYAIITLHDNEIGEAGHSIDALEKNEKVENK